MIVTKMDATDRTAEPSLNSTVILLCWNCGTALSKITEVALNDSGVSVCSHCGTATAYRNGIWIAISPRRLDRFRQFIADYEFIRTAEGRGSSQPDYYLGLPYEDISGRNRKQWAIRAHTFQTMERLIFKPLAKLHKRPFASLTWERAMVG